MPMRSSSSHSPMLEPEDSGSSELYKIAYDLGLRTLEDQRDELNGARTRACAYMAFVGSATGFLVGTTLRGASAPAGGWFYMLAIAGTATFVFALLFMCMLLFPRLPFNFGQSPKFIVEQYIERDVPPPTKEELLRQLCMDWDEYIMENGRSLKPIRQNYRLLMISGGLSLILWTSAIWMFGRVGV